MLIEWYYNDIQGGNGFMDKIKVYLDNCAYNRPFDDQKQLRISLETQAKLYIQSLIENEEIDLVWSYVCELENYNNPFENKKFSIAKFSENAKYSIIENINILTTANKIMQSGIDPVDSLHLSCAINAGVDYFITVDDRLLRYKIKDIEIIDPIMFIKKWGNIGGKHE
jgi:predicted nucleic acid-binding protein